MCLAKLDSIVVNLIAISAIMTLGCVLKKSENGAITYLIKARYSNKNVDAI